MDRCRRCGKPLEQKPTGRPRIWCSDACRKAYGRAFAVIPPDLRPLPAPARVRKIGAHERLALVLSELEANQRELAVMTRELDDSLGWRADELAERIRTALDLTFGGII